MAWKSIEDIDIWNLSRTLSAEVFDFFQNKPQRTDFSLKDQMNRSSGSIMDNIAEGFGRGGNKEFTQFLFYSKGSCLELKSQFYRCFDRGYLNDTELKEFLDKTEAISNKTSALIASLKKSVDKGYRYR